MDLVETVIGVKALSILFAYWKDGISVCSSVDRSESAVFHEPSSAPLKVSVCFLWHVKHLCMCVGGCLDLFIYLWSIDTKSKAHCQELQFFFRLEIVIAVFGNGILNVIVVTSEICRFLFLPTQHLNFGPYVLRYQRAFYCWSLDQVLCFVWHQDPNICCFMSL